MMESQWIFPLLNTYNAIILIVVVICLIFLKLFFNGAWCYLNADLSSHIIIVTGSNRGIGFQTALELARRNATIILACRDVRKAQEARKFIVDSTKNQKIDIMPLDLSEIHSVRCFAENFKAKYQRLDILINNAGVTFPDRRLTKDGFEAMIATNHLGPFLLTNLLLDVLKSSQPSRIINVSSVAHTYGYLNLKDINSEKYYNIHLTYGGTKIANILFTNEMATKLEGTSVKICCLHPGVIRSGFIADIITKNFVLKVLIVLLYPVWWFFTKSEVQGAQTSLYCALMPHQKLENGKYYNDCKVGKTRGITHDTTLMKELWEISKEMVKL